MKPTQLGVSERPFTIADGLVLIIAVAVGLALVRVWQDPAWCGVSIGFWPGQRISDASRLVHAVSVGISSTIPFAMTFSAALLGLRFRSPGPSIRRIVRQPGPVACASALATIAYRLGLQVYCWALGYLTRPQSAIHLPSPPFMRYDNPGFHPPPGEWIRRALLDTFPLLVSPAVTAAVAVGWCVLRASGRWRPASDWIDRSGRWLGWYWIALGVVIAAISEATKFII